MKSTKITIYTKSGERAATTYYRIYQYIREIEGRFRYRKMIPDKMYKRIMPISSQSLPIKASIFFYIIIRVFVQLFKDVINKPHFLILSRRFVNRIFPLPYKWMLSNLKKRGTKIIWDFDDEIIESKEITRNGFDYMSQIADHIIVASPVNKEMIKSLYWNKIIVLPTTDGDMYRLFTDEVIINRLSLLNTEVRLIWVGTSVSLKFVKQIIPSLDRFAIILEKKYNKRLILTIVCDKPLIANNIDNLLIRNIKWERHIAIEEMLKSHIGLMPLENNKFCKGKGGFKLIQYLSVGLPVIGSPVGINASIISKDVGCCIDCLESESWGEAIDEICQTNQIWHQFSINAYSKWSQEFNYNNNLKTWKKLLL